MEGSWKRVGSWAPCFAGWRYGPSAWAPRSDAADSWARGVRAGRS